jgi:hypothetical protein
VMQGRTRQWLIGTAAVIFSRQPAVCPAKAGGP